MTANGAAKDYSVISQKDPEKDAVEMKVQNLFEKIITETLSCSGPRRRECRWLEEDDDDVERRHCDRGFDHRVRHLRLPRRSSPQHGQHQHGARRLGSRRCLLHDRRFLLRRAWLHDQELRFWR